jgi:thiazole synthase ThiGH ThiG subunit
MGASVWTRGMGLEACRLACRFVKEQTRCLTVVDPFCGRGTVLAAANELGLDAVGVELAKKRARQAKALTVAGVESGAKREDGSKR